MVPLTSGTVIQILMPLLVLSMTGSISIQFSARKQNWRLGHRQLSMPLNAVSTESEVDRGQVDLPRQFDWQPVQARSDVHPVEFADSSANNDQTLTAQKKKQRRVQELYRPQTLYPTSAIKFNKTGVTLLQSVESNPWLQRYAPFYYPQNPEPQQAHQRKADPEPKLRHLVIGDQVMVPPKVEFADQVLQTLHEAKFRFIEEQEKKSHAEAHMENKKEVETPHVDEIHIADTWEKNMREENIPPVIDTFTANKHNNGEVSSQGGISSELMAKTRSSDTNSMSDNDKEWQPKISRTNSNLVNYGSRIEEISPTKLPSNSFSYRGTSFQNNHIATPWDNIKIMPFELKEKKKTKHNNGNSFSPSKALRGYSRPKQEDIIQMENSPNAIEIPSRFPGLELSEYGTLKPSQTNSDENRSEERYENEYRSASNLSKGTESSNAVSNGKTTVEDNSEYIITGPIREQPTIENEQMVDSDIMETTSTFTNYFDAETESELYTNEASTQEDITTNPTIVTAHDFTVPEYTDPTTSTLRDLAGNTDPPNNFTDDTTLITEATTETSLTTELARGAADEEASLYDVEASLSNGPNSDQTNQNSTNQTLKTRNAAFPYRNYAYNYRRDKLESARNAKPLRNTGFITEWELQNNADKLNSQYEISFQEHLNERPTTNKRYEVSKDEYYRTDAKDKPDQLEFEKTTEESKFAFSRIDDQFNHPFFEKTQREPHNGKRLKNEDMQTRNIPSVQQEGVDTFGSNFGEWSQQGTTPPPSAERGTRSYQNSGHQRKYRGDVNSDYKDWDSNEHKKRYTETKADEDAVPYSKDPKFWSWEDIETQITRQFPEFGVKWNKVK